MTTNETGMSVDNEQLAMIAEVDLETVASPFGRLEAGNPDPRLLHQIQTGVRQLQAADFVKEW
ncbi:MAG: hypothetical protein KDI74_16820 [Gammaproteobacteria bacterium]|nr:hypothetical protein [Gammaproteobacteria bacterium]